MTNSNCRHLQLSILYTRSGSYTATCAECGIQQIYPGPDGSVKAEMEQFSGEIREWLGEEGLSFFRRVKQEHGRIDAIWNEGGIPHIVHFREGMQVRNRLRELTNNRYTADQYDGCWVHVVEKAIQ